MAYVPLLSLLLRHEYHGADAPPVALRIADGGAFDTAGGVVKARGARLDLYRPEDMTPPDRVAIDVLPDGMAIVARTALPPGDGVPVVPVAATSGGEIAAPVDAATLAAAGTCPPQPGLPRLVCLELSLPTDGAAAQVTVTLPAVATVWAYHVLGARGTLDVVEREGRIAFTETGETALPDGRSARTWRSDRAIPLRARQDFNVTLTRTRDFGPEPLISALPVPGRATSKPAAAGAGAALQSDIYVTL